MEPEEPLITAEDVAPILKVKAGTVYDAASRGLIPCVRLWKGRRKSLLRFRRSEIEKFIRDRSVPAGGGSASRVGSEANSENRIPASRQRGEK